MNVLKVIFNSHIKTHALQKELIQKHLLPDAVAAKCVYAHMCVRESLCVLLYIVFIVQKHGECLVEVDVCQEGPETLREALICVCGCACACARTHMRPSAMA